MSLPAPLARVAAMPRDELVFRTQCEVRKLRERALFAVAPPAWRPADLSRVMREDAGPLVARACAFARRGDRQHAHLLLCRHFQQRGRRWPLHAGARDTLVASVLEDFPAAEAAARERGDRILLGRFDLLGYRDVDAGNPPDWHADPVHRRRAPGGFWGTLPYLDPSVGDHKVIWEINRHQYFVTLGIASWLTGDRRYRNTFVAHVRDWVRSNPPLDGINWASMLELAFRCLSWTWAIEFFAADAKDDPPWLPELLVALDRQLAHIEHNLSIYFSPNTHLTGEALALFAVSLALPELRGSAARVERGRAVLAHEAHRQVRADGGHAELSAHYHRYSTDFYLFASEVARICRDPGAADLAKSARAQASFLRTIADDRGSLPLLGDDDGGQLFAWCGHAPADASVSLGMAAEMFDDCSLAVGRHDPAIYWILGGRPATAPPPRAARWPSRLLRESGYFVSRTDEGGHLIFDAGPHGFLNGGHAHADALSVVLTVNGLPLLVDPGTATYTMDAEARDRFRSARMHNTVTIGGHSFAQPAGPFHWASRAEAWFAAAHVGEPVEFAVGTHDGFDGRHTRAVVVLPGTGWLIVDLVRGDGDTMTTADLWWHLHPSWLATVTGNRAALQHLSGARGILATTAAGLAIETDPKLDAFSPEYGRIQSAMTLRAAIAGAAPAVAGTFIPAPAAGALAAFSEILPREVSDDWIVATFAIGLADRELRIRVPLPARAAAQPDGDWPQPCIQELRAVCVE